MNARMLLTSVAGGLVTAIVVAGCPLSGNDKCTAICRDLQECRLLPSALGTETYGVSAESNCVARCNQTSDTVALQTVDDCFGHTPRDDGGRCSARCETVSNCILAKYPNDGIVGSASLLLTFVEGAPPDAGADLEVCTPDAGVAPDAGEDPYARASVSPVGTTRGTVADEADGIAVLPKTGDWALDWCNNQGASTARAFVIRAGAYSFGPALPCQQLLSTGSTFDALSPGRVTTGIELRRVGDGAYCNVLYGPRVALAAGQAASVAVSLRLSAARRMWRCEEGALCHDGADNDINGVADCSDPRCADECAVDAGSPTDASRPDAEEDAGIDGDAQRDADGAE